MIILIIIIMVILLLKRIQLRIVFLSRKPAEVPSSALKLILAKRFRDQLSASLDAAALAV